MNVKNRAQHSEGTGSGFVTVVAVSVFVAVFVVRVVAMTVFVIADVIGSAFISRRYVVRMIVTVRVIVVVINGVRMWFVRRVRVHRSLGSTVVSESHCTGWVRHPMPSG
jgi:hypothetical protein